MKRYPFPTNQYIPEEHKKTQIYLHHTAGSPSAENVFKGWESNQERIATFAVISGGGEVVRGFDPKHWAFHLGLKESVFQKQAVKYRNLDKISIGIEICNWGQLTYKDRKFYTYTGREVSKDLVMVLDKPHRGHRYYYDYTSLQIESTRELLIMLGAQFGIPLKYNPDIWDVTKRALEGRPGLYTHNSVRYDKNDVYPHPKLIQMLQTL